MRAEIRGDTMLRREIIQLSTARGGEETEHQFRKGTKREFMVGSPNPFLESPVVTFGLRDMVPGRSVHHSTSRSSEIGFKRGWNSW